jgi:hypothetical protein
MAELLGWGGEGVKVGIVGHGADKFTPETEWCAKSVIYSILFDTAVTLKVISGRSPMGGIDIWTEEIAIEMGLVFEPKEPKQHCWDAEYGYKQRNLDIAKQSNTVHVILVKEYPDGYVGRRFPNCYHCVKHFAPSDHVKSGGCWTGWKAKEFGNEVIFHIIQDPDIVYTRWG